MTKREAVVPMIEAWDRGETIPTLSMGGLGPGYEQAIQIAAVEFVRAAAKADADITGDGWKEHCEGVLKRIDDGLGGLSGAQFGAAAQLSWMFYDKGGPVALQAFLKNDKDISEDRFVLVSKFFPKAPE